MPKKKIYFLLACMKQVLKIKFLYIKIVVKLKKIFFPELIRSATAKQIKVILGIISWISHTKSSFATPLKFDKK